MEIQQRNCLLHQQKQQWIHRDTAGEFPLSGESYYSIDVPIMLQRHMQRACSVRWALMKRRYFRSPDEGGCKTAAVVITPHPQHTAVAGENLTPMPKSLDYLQRWLLYLIYFSYSLPFILFIY